jgi:DNA-binding SARP family transcriptional activator
LTALLRLDFLGDFHLVHGDTPVTGVENPRLQSLLAYLVLHRDAPQSRAQLSYLFWLDSTEAQARTNLRKQVYHLRRALPDADRFLYADRNVLHWLPDAPFLLDVADFEEALHRAEEAERAGDQATLQKALEAAAASYHGNLLPNCYDDWVLTERERLRQDFARTLERLIGLLERQRAYSAAIQVAQRLLRHDPLHEAAYRRLMRLHALHGDRARALRTYHTCATVLQRELDVEPSTATQEAYDRLLALDAAAAPPAERLTPETALVGRDQEWAQLQSAWTGAADGQPRFVLLTGEAGMGKTRLAEELLEWAQRQGIPTASARCYASEGGLAYGPVTNWLHAPALKDSLASLDQVWLSEIARLLPELLVEHHEIPPPGPMTEGWQRQRLYQALGLSFFQHRQLLLALDDAQWCDPETLEWLPSLMRPRRGHAPVVGPTQLLLVITLRSGERPARGRLETLLGELRRSRQLREIELGPLGQAETFSLATDVAGRALDPALAEPLYQGSEGNPLFVVEMVRAGGTMSAQQMVEHGREKTRVDLTLPPKVQQVIQARLAQLSPAARELVGTAATIGREFTFDVLAQAHGANEETSVRALDELWRRRIVREQGEDAYDFSHDRIREVAYAGLSTARQRLLHRRVAQALEEVHAADLEAVAGQLAAHYEQAGQADRAVLHYQRAAGVAQRIYAHKEAVEHLRRAVGLLPETGSDGGQGAQLHEQLGKVMALMGQHEAAHQVYEAAVARAPAADSLWRARLQCAVANACRSRQHFPEAAEAYDTAIEFLGPEPAGPDPEWWRAWLDIQLARADMLYYASKLSELSELCQELEDIVTARGSVKQQSNFYHALVMLDNRQSRFRPSAETVGHITRSLELARQTGDRQLIDFKMFGRGFTLLWFGHLEDAERQLRAALGQAEQTGNLPLQDRCLAYLSIACRLKGDEGQARAYMERGLEAALTEQNTSYVGVAKANLAWLHYRQGNLDEALREGSAALQQWRPLAYPIEWLARWPLLAVRFLRGQIDAAIDQARAMIDSGQQQLPDHLEALLEESIQAWDEGREEPARKRLKQAINSARENGSL